MNKPATRGLAALFLFLTNAQAFAGAGHGGQQEATGELMNASSLIPALGILTLLAILTTLTLGLTMRKNRKLLFPWHKRMAITTVIIALIHAALVVTFH